MCIKVSAAAAAVWKGKWRLSASSDGWTNAEKTELRQRPWAKTKSPEVKREKTTTMTTNEEAELCLLCMWYLVSSTWEQCWAHHLKCGVQAYELPEITFSTVPACFFPSCVSPALCLRKSQMCSMCSLWLQALLMTLFAILPANIPCIFPSRSFTMPALKTRVTQWWRVKGSLHKRYKSENLAVIWPDWDGTGRQADRGE